MKKKIFIAIGLFLLLILSALVAIPIFFKDQIKAKIQQTINNNITAKVAFEDAGLSLFKNFPQASVSIKKLTIINKAPFAGDTLVAFDELILQMSVQELLKGEKEPMKIKAVSLKNAKLNVMYNLQGVANYDIAIKENKPEDKNKKDKPFAMNIEQYALENCRITYFDQRSKIKMVLDKLNHQGTGNFAKQNLDLNTKTTATIALDMDKINYMNNIAISLDAVLGIDLKNSKYTFKDNKAKINELPLEFNGYLQMLPQGQQYDLSFKTPTTSFQNFLALIPSAYAGNLNTVKTTGDFNVLGNVNGMLTDTTIPKFNIAIASANASFKYPSLPKSVQKIHINTKIINQTGIANDTYVNLEQLSFQIDQDVFNAKADIHNIATNPLVNATLKGTINLANLTKAYPLKLNKPLSGILNADVVTKFDMQSVEKSQYQNIKNTGSMTLTGFTYTGPEMAKPVQIKQASVAFNTAQIQLKNLELKTGNSDLQISGTLDNFYGFLFKKQILKGNFNLNSNQLLVSDFMQPTKTSTQNTNTTEAESATTSAKSSNQALKIPAFLDCAITAKANTVIYDHLVLKTVSGKMVVKNETLALQNVKTSIFDGQIGLNGLVSTKTKTPTFNVNLALNKIDIAQSFTQLDLFKKILPIASAITGKMNSSIALNGNLNATQMTPDLNSVSGDFTGQLLSAKINPNQAQLVTALSSQLKFIEINKININDIKTALSFKNGKVIVKPFKIKYQDITAEIAGEHGYDQNMNYNIKMNVPAKYLGNDINKILSKLTPSDAAKIENVPITALMTGNFKSPKVSTDLKQASTNLAIQVAKLQKDKLINKGTDALTNILNKNRNNSADTTKITNTKKDEIKKAAGDLLNGLFGKKK